MSFMNLARPAVARCAAARSVRMFQTKAAEPKSIEDVVDSTEHRAHVCRMTVKASIIERCMTTFSCAIFAFAWYQIIRTVYDSEMEKGSYDDEDFEDEED
ncbi:hypothetical protein DIPPA_02892 [Diplonema papillatum]|nr:hypothetical protein DIPPA_02892 [Diplonema papillatum]